MSIVCFHLPAFPAWALTYRMPSLHPVIVEERGRVVCASPVLELRGLARGTAVERAGRLYADAHIVPRDAAAEVLAWDDVLERLLGVTPFIEPEAPGLAYAGVEAPSEPAEVAATVRARVCVADHRTTARLGAHRAAPGHVLRLPARSFKAFLRRCPVAVLGELGFTPALVERLQLLGFTYLGAAHRLTRRHLEAQFGGEGGRLYSLLHPRKEPPVGAWRPPPRIREHYDADGHVLDANTLPPYIDYLIERAAARLDGQACQRVLLRLSTGDGPPLEARRILQEPTADARVLARIAQRLLASVATDTLGAHRVTCELSGLRPADEPQADLFARRAALAKAVARVEAKYRATLYRAVLDEHAVFHEDQVTYRPFE